MQTSQEKNKQSALHKNSSPQSRLLEIEREFNVPVSQLFEAFKTSEALKAWWWPKGLYADRIDLDFREGGKYFINMKGVNASSGMVGEIEEIIDEKRIVMSDQFADKNGNVISAEEANMPGGWPEFVYITFEFNSLDENTSKIKMSQQGIPNDAQKDCKQGWAQMFDKLEDYLSGRKQ